MKYILLLLIFILKYSIAGIPVVTSIVRNSSCDRSYAVGQFYCYDVHWTFLPISAGDTLPPQNGGPFFTGWLRKIERVNSVAPYNLVWIHAMSGITDSGESWNTMAEKFRKMWGSSGTIQVSTMSPNNKSKICFMFGSKTFNDGSQPTHIPGGQQPICTTIDPSPNSCQITSGDIVLDYGDVLTYDIQDLRKKSTINFQCGAPSVAKISAIGLANGKLNVGPGIDAYIMVNGENIANGVDVDIPNDKKSVIIESILNADKETIQPGAFSASLVIRTDFF